MPLSRRTFLKGAAAAGGLLATGRAAAPAIAADLGLPANAPIDHTVVLMMENRSFDHLLGWLPGANTEQHCTFLDDEGNPHETRHWAPDYTGNGYADPDHGWNGGRVQLGGEARDNSGFAKGRNDDFALGYYQRDDVPVYAAMAEQTTVFDRYHTAALGPTYVNRWYQHAGTAGGRRSNDFAPNPIEGWQERTIWDALDESGVTWAYYFSNLPVIGLYGERLLLRRLTNCRHISAYYADCAAGTLPQVAFVDPFFTVDGVGNDDHPHADLRLGQQFVDGVVSAFTSSSAWASGALFVNYDEWGGFFDHVVPTAARHDDHKSPVLADDSSQRGFRVPAFLASPYARRGVVAHGTYDHTSILRFLEWRYGLRPLSKRSATARNIGEVLDFAATPNLDPVAPGYVAPPDAWANVGATDLSMDLTAIRDIGLTDALRIRTDWAFEDSFLR